MYMFDFIFSTRSSSPTAREAAEPAKPQPQTRCRIPPVICWCGGVQVAVPGYLSVPEWGRDRGGEEGGACPARSCPQDAKEVGYKRRCHLRSALPDTQDHPSLSALIAAFFPSYLLISR